MRSVLGEEVGAFGKDCPTALLDQAQRLLDAPAKRAKVPGAKTIGTVARYSDRQDEGRARG